MKIVGTTSDGFILTASKSEVAKLIGYYSEYNKLVGALKSGDEINVHGMYQRLYEMTHAQDRLSSARRELEGVIKAFEEMSPLIESVKPELPKDDS